LLPALGRAAAVAVLLLAGAGGGWLARDQLGGEMTAEGIDLPHLAASAHLIYAAEVRHPVEVGADEEEHLVRWLSKRLGADVKAPNLTQSGYRLVGGRLLPAGNGVAGQFMYENPAGTRLTLFLASGRERNETAFRFVEEDGVSVFYWRDAGFGYALSAELPREALLALCNEVYAQISPGGPPASW
jgi:anti-sigma factor RsiW